MSDTIYEGLCKKGITRKEFLKMCGVLALALGYESSFASTIAHAMETKRRLPVIYHDFQECTCCAESFIRSSHPLFSDLILNMISLDYMEPLMAPSGFQAEESRAKTIRESKGKYLLIVEGSVPVNDGGVYCTIGGRTALDLLHEAARDSVAVIAYGSCATNTCASGASPNPTGARAIKDLVTYKPVIDVPGCPPIAEVITGVIVHYLTFDRIPELTNMNRPAAFYDHRIHDNCNRRAYFDAGLFVEKFDDVGAKQGWCLYKVGCKGPTTYNACPITQWNNGVSYPIKSGHPCIGCSEPNYFDNFPLYERLAHIPGQALSKDPDKIGKAVAGLTAAGVAVHAVATGIIKRDKLKSEKNGERERN